MEAALVGAVAGAVLSNVVAKLTAVIATRFSELGKLAGDINSLKTDLAMIASKIEGLQKGRPSELQLISMTTMRELAFDIEDCLDQFLPCAACEGGAGSILEVEDFAVRVGVLKTRLKEAHKQIQDYGANDSQQATNVPGQSAGTEDVATTPRAADQVGMEKPKQEILGLLGSENLVAISIVGFGGSGKTELAWAVYDCSHVKNNFGLRAWAVASKHKDGDGLLLAILKDLLPGEPVAVPRTEKQVSRFRQQIRVAQRRHQPNRCLIVIDDIKMHHWEPIKSFFSKLTIKMLLTTTVQSVANTCTADRGYIYNMRTLSLEDSKDLLRKRVCKLDGPSPDLAVGSAAIVHRCHGHPLALTSVANYLLKQDRITRKFCQDTSRLICTHTDENKHGIFTELRQLLVNNYTDLPGDLKTCLLYTSLFPSDHPVSRKTLTSRWLAEGYIGDERERSAQEVAEENLKELMDRNIIRPIDASSSGEPKTCKPQGIMHQFMLYKSISSNFIATSLKNRGNFRHLVIANNANGEDHGPVPDARPRSTRKKISSWFRKSIGKGGGQQLRPRSLAVFGSAEEAVYSDLLKCKLLRVLDLKECNDNLSKHHRKCIYKLRHLRYLTLGGSINKLEDKMEDLHCLETLDLRKTKIENLPVEVISLPHLAHLFGKIKLQKFSWINRNKFLGAKCNLQTLAGVIVDNNSGFPELMDHMKKLTKVKIWCEITSTDSNNYTLLSNAIHQYLKLGLGTPDDSRSLSLHLNDCSQELLRGHDDYYLSAMKLQGRPNQFSEFVQSLSGLEELCLTSAKLTEADLPALRTLQRLVCLKLVQDDLQGLHINPQDFRSLQRLCLVVRQPRFPTFAENALPSLTSLQLLCGGLDDLGDIKIENFKALCAVALDSAVHLTTIQLWEEETKKHPKRPNIVLLKRVNPADTRSAVKYVATDLIPSGYLVHGMP